MPAHERHSSKVVEDTPRERSCFRWLIEREENELAKSRAPRGHVFNTQQIGSPHWTTFELMRSYVLEAIMFDFNFSAYRVTPPW